MNLSASSPADDFPLLPSCGQAQTEENKQRADRAVENRGDSLIAAQTFAEGGRKEGENQTPSRAGNHERKAERNERGYFRVRSWIDELRQEREKEESDFWIEEQAKIMNPEQVDFG